MAHRKLDVVIAEADPNVRSRLKQSVMAVPEFGRCLQAVSPSDAQRRAEEDAETRTVDIIFISSRFPVDSVRQFIETAKTQPKTQDAAFVMMLESGAKTKAAMGERMLIGTDAFLCEPYSIDQLVAICQTAASVRRDRAAAREAAAAKLILKDVAKHLDIVWQMRTMKFDGETAVCKFKEDCARLGQLRDMPLETFHRLMLDTFELAIVPNLPSHRLTYEGKSTRVRQRVERVMQERLNNPNGDNGGAKVRLPRPKNPQTSE
jgi:DNA-binding NarL/FixJ family response regulator